MDLFLLVDFEKKAPTNKNFDAKLEKYEKEYLFSEPCRTDDRTENLENYYILDPDPALYTDTLDGKMEMPAMFSKQLNIS